MSEMVATESELKEIPSKTTFEAVEDFLKTHGKVGSVQREGETVEEYQYEKPVTFIDKALFGQKETNQRIVRIRQKVSDNVTSPDIKISILNKGRNSLNPKAQMMLVNPAKEGKIKAAFLFSLDPLRKWLGTDMEAWYWHKDKLATDSEEEANKIARIIFQRNVYAEGQPKLSRRQFLGLSALTGAAALDTFLAHTSGYPSLSKGFWEHLATLTLGLSAEQLKDEIEKNFKVDIVTPNADLNEIGWGGHKHPVVEWDSPRLKGLIRVLSELPPNFYSPKKVGEKEYKIRFALVAVNREDLQRHGADFPAGFCACHAAQEQLIVIDKRFLGQTFQEAGVGRRILVHELAHAVTTPNIQGYIDNITKQIGITGIPQLRKAFASEIEILSRNNPVSPNVVDFTDEDIRLGKVEIESERPDYLKDNEVPVIDRRGIVSHYAAIEVAPGWYVQNGRFRRLGEEFFKDLHQKIQDQIEFGGNVKSKTHLGHGAINFYEFFSVAAEYYLKGRGEFISIYERFLGRERAENLYDGVKKEIFLGKEY